MSARPDIAARLVLVAAMLRGEHVVFYGPRGVGKTAILHGVRNELKKHGVACAFAVETAALADITSALASALAPADVSTLTQRRLRGRVRAAAENRRAVVLLDHVTEVTPAMKGFLRSLRGGLVGAVLAVDVDVQRERERMRSWRVSHHELEAPIMRSTRLRCLLRVELRRRGLAAIARSDEIRLVRAAKGRPGWIVRCCELAEDPSYWLQGAPRVAALHWETELAVRGAGQSFGLRDQQRVDSKEPSC